MMATESIATISTEIKKPFLKKINFYSKLTIFIWFVVVAMVFSNPIHLLPFVGFIIILCIFAQVKLKEFIGMLKSVLGIFFFLFIFSALVYDVNAAHSEIAKITYFSLIKTQYLNIGLTSGGMLSGLAVILKMVIMILASNLFAATTTIEEMLFGLNRIGIPYQFGLMLSIALRFIPTLKKEVSQIQQAQKSRGATSKKIKGQKRSSIQGVIPLFVPMIVSSMRRSDTMAMSMTSRGYGFAKHRTQMLEIPFGITQIFFSAAALGVIALFIYVKTKYGIGLL